MYNFVRYIYYNVTIFVNIFSLNKIDKLKGPFYPRSGYKFLIWKQIYQVEWDCPTPSGECALLVSAVELGPNLCSTV